MKRWQLQLMAAVALYIAVGICAYLKAVQKHYGVQFPSGRGFAVVAVLAFSAFFGYRMVEAISSGIVGVGGKSGNPSYIRRDERPSSFYWNVLIYLAASLLFFLFERLVYVRYMTQPNHSLEPTPIGRSFAVDIVIPAWLSFGR